MLFLALGAQLGCAAKPAPEAEYKSDQSYCDAIELMCDVDVRAKIDAEADILERGELRESYIGDNLKNPDAIYFRTLWRVKIPAERAQSLRDEAKEAGLSGCALADSLAQEQI